MVAARICSSRRRCRVGSGLPVGVRPGVATGESIETICAPSAALVRCRISASSAPLGSSAALHTRHADSDAPSSFQPQPHPILRKRKRQHGSLGVWESLACAQCGFDLARLQPRLRTHPPQLLLNTQPVVS